MSSRHGLRFKICDSQVGGGGVTQHAEFDSDDVIALGQYFNDAIAKFNNHGQTVSPQASTVYK